jgi:hypothetical protein
VEYDMPDPTPTPTAEYENHRIFCEWDCGAYISTLDSDFRVTFPRMVKDFGPPDKVEFRAHNEGWVHSQPVLALCPACIAKVGGATPVPVYVECVDGEPCEAADHDDGDDAPDYLTMIGLDDGVGLDPDLDPAVSFTVVWDNGPATGEFGIYPTEIDAAVAGEDWRLTMILEDEDPDAAEEAYTFHVAQIPTPPERLDPAECETAPDPADPTNLDGCDCGIYIDSGAPDFTPERRNCDCVTNR